MRRLALLLSAVLAGSVLSGCGSVLSSGDQQGFVTGSGDAVIVPVAERKAPVGVSGGTIDGGRASLSDYRGKVVVMPVWGSWCGPCRAEAPMLQEESVALAASGVQFLGINVRDEDKAARDAFMRNNGITWPSFDNADGSLLLGLAQGLGPKTIPSVVFVDPQGRVAAVVIGEITRTTLEQIVQEIAP